MKPILTALLLIAANVAAAQSAAPDFDDIRFHWIVTSLKLSVFSSKAVGYQLCLCKFKRYDSQVTTC